jgi:hypothetical protein
MINQARAAGIAQFSRRRSVTPTPGPCVASGASAGWTASSSLLLVSSAASGAGASATVCVDTASSAGASVSGSSVDAAEPLTRLSACWMRCSSSL